MNRDDRRQAGDASGHQVDYVDETLPGASATGSRIRAPGGAEVPNRDLLGEFSMEGLPIEELAERAAKDPGEGGVAAVKAIAASGEPKAREALLRIYWGTRDHYGRMRESEKTREAAVHALGADVTTYRMMLGRIYGEARPLEKLVAIHVVGTQMGPEATEALAYAAKQGAPASDDSGLTRARLAIHYLQDRDDRSALDAILHVAKWGAPAIRPDAVLALGHRGEPEAWALIKRLATDDADRAVRIAANRAMS